MSGSSRAPAVLTDAVGQGPIARWLRDWLRTHAREANGAICPTCDAFTKVYKRRIHTTMARQLIHAVHYTSSLAEADPQFDGYFHAPTLFGYGGAGDFAKLAYWRLIEPAIGQRVDGSDRIGIWRITDRGHAFVNRRLAVKEWALVYNGQVFELEGQPRTIVDALGKNFDYDELMGRS